MGFGRDDIRACANCGQGIGPAGPFFYRVKVEQFVLDMNAIRREAGLEQVMGGNAQIARALSPETDFAQTFQETEVLLCSTCGFEPLAAIHLLGRADDEDREGA